MRKQIFTCGLLLVLIVLTFTPHATAQEKINFAYISPTPSATSIFWIAKEAGFFKKNGLDVNMTYIEGSPKALQALLAGELQIIHTTGPAVVNAKLSGADAVMIMGIEVFLPYYLVAAPTITRVEELKGRIGANHTAATSADVAIRLGLRGLGIDPERDVQLRSVGATNLRIAALKQGVVQFTVVSIAEKEAAEALGFKVLANFAQHKIPFRTPGSAPAQSSCASVGKRS